MIVSNLARVSERVSRAAAVAAVAILLTACSESPEQMVASARDYLAKNELNAASIQLKNALQQDGKLAEARFLLGAINLRQGNVAGAEKELRRAAELGFPGVEVSPLLARSMVQLGEHDRVLREFEGRQVGEPGADARLLAAIGDAYFAKAEFDKARGAFDAALERLADEPSAMLGRARSKFVAGDLDGAMADADAVVASAAAGDTLPEAHALRADIWLARGEVDKALTDIDVAIRARPATVGYHFAAIVIELREGTLDKAETRVGALAKAAPKHPVTRYVQALIEQRKGNLAAARTHIAETVRLMPDYLPGRLLAGMIHAALNEHAQAQEHLGAVAGRAPRHEGARRALALSHLNAGAPQQAMETLAPLLDVATPDTSTLRLAGRIYVALGDTERAAEIFERVAAATPDDASARTQLGIARLLEGDLEKGVGDLEAASELSTSEGEADVALILVNLRRGKLDSALAAQQELERKRPDDPRTFALKGGIMLAKRDQQAARAAFEKALVLKPDYLPAATNLSRLDLADNRGEDARRRFESVIAANPASVDAYLLLGGVTLGTGGTPADARAVLERAAKAVPQSPAPRLALVAHELRFGDAKRSVALARELVAAYPGDPRAHKMLGQAHLAARDVPQALDAFSRQSTLLPRAAQPLVELAEVQSLNKDFAAAEQSLRKALGLNAVHLEAQQRLSAILVATQRIDEALAVAHGVQKQRPASSAGWVLEGDIHAAVKSWAPAQQGYRKAFEREGVGQTLVKLHAAYMLGGKTADAAKLAGDWLRAQPRDLFIRNYLAEAAIATGRLADAEKLYREMDAIRPDDPNVINNLAWIAGQRGDPGAMALAERAVALAPQNPAILDTLGELQMAQGQPEKGLESLRKAVDIAPDRPVLRANLARAYAQVGRKEDARKEFDAALERLPDDSPQRKLIEEMKEKL